MVTVTIDGEQFELVNLDDLSFADQREVKRLSGGMSAAALGEGLQEFDADAWFAVVLFSIRRKRPDYSADALGAVNFTALMKTVMDSILESSGDVAVSVPLSAAEALTGDPSVNGSEIDALETLGHPA